MVRVRDISVGCLLFTARIKVFIPVWNVLECDGGGVAAIEVRFSFYRSSIQSTQEAWFLVYRMKLRYPCRISEF